MKMLRTSKLLRDTDGSVGVEYALIASLISVLIAAAASQIGGEVVAFFEAVVAGFHVV